MTKITITKRDGRVVDFNVKKIYHAIEEAYKDTFETDIADEEKVLEVTNKVVKAVRAKKQLTMTVEQIQDIVEDTLIKTKEVELAKKYIGYRANRTQIREAASTLMLDYKNITFTEAEESNTKRDNANVDGNTAMGTMLQYGALGSKHFAVNHIFKREYSAAHQQGDIHIHDLDFVPMGTTTCSQIDLTKLFKNGFNTGHGFLREPQDIMSYAALAAIAIQSNQNDQHGGQSIPNFDSGLAVGVRKSFIRAYKDNLVKAFVYSANVAEEDVRAAVDEAVANYGDSDYARIDETLFTQYAVNEEIKLFGIICSKSDCRKQKISYCQKRAYAFAKKETIKKTYQAMEGFLHNLNTMHSRAGAQVPFSSINFGTDTSAEGRLIVEQFLLATEAGLGNGETAIFPISIFRVKEGINYNPGEPNYDLFKLAMRCSAKRLFPNFSFQDAPFNLQYYKEGRPETEISYMGCRTRSIGSVFPESDGVVFGRGNISFSSINLPRLGLKHGIATGQREVADMDGFYKEFDEKIDLVIGQLLERFEVQCNKKVKNFPFLMGQGIWMNAEELNSEDTLEEIVKHGTLTIGFIGLAETLKALIGKHHGESEEAQKLGIEIIGHLRQRMDEASKQYNLNFSVIATPAEGLSGRFIRMDKKTYGKIEGITDREYYTNSNHVPVYYSINAAKKIELEAPYHEFSNGGHICYVECDGDISQNIEAFEMIIRKMKESGIGYGSVNHPIDRDPVCGYNGVIGDVCPKCGRSEQAHKEGKKRFKRSTCC